MKKTTPRTITNSDRKGKRVLRLSQDTVRVLGSGDLAQAVSGCNTTSWSTERLTTAC